MTTSWGFRPTPRPLIFLWYYSVSTALGASGPVSSRLTNPLATAREGRSAATLGAGTAPDIHKPERSITYPAQPPRVEAEPGWDRVEKTRPTAHSNQKGDTPPSPAQIPLGRRGRGPIRRSRNRRRGRGGGRNSLWLLPKGEERERRNALPRHAGIVLRDVSPEIGGGRQNRSTSSPPSCSEERPCIRHPGQHRTDHGSAYDKVLSQRIHLSAKILRQAGIMHRTLRYT